MIKNVLTDEEIEDMTLDEKEENLKKLQEEIDTYKNMEE